jgi:hypothetical protein
VGSIIEVFPGSRDSRRPSSHVRTLRSAAGTSTAPIRVRGARLQDLAAIRALQRDAHPGFEGWTPKQLESQRSAFPEGQLVATCDGEIVGVASALVVQWDDHALDPTWHRVTGDGFFTTHDTEGRTLFCAEMAVDVSRHGVGASRVLNDAQRRLCRKLNLRRIIGAARLPGYHTVSAKMSPELYVQRVICGDSPDAALRFQLSQGYQFCGIAKGYWPADAESCGHAALLAWLNPLFSPTEPPANVETERPRKCA